MPYDIIRNNLTQVKADAIVNSANPDPTYGSGVDRAIYKAAGVHQLLEARKEIGTISPGQAVSTSAFNLNAKYIIHTVGPKGPKGPEEMEEACKTLRECYRNSLTLARELSCTSVAFPLIASGANHFPKDKAIKIALQEIEQFLFSEDTEMFVDLVLLDRQSLKLVRRIRKVKQTIDSRHARKIWSSEYERNFNEPYEAPDYSKTHTSSNTKVQTPNNITEKPCQDCCQMILQKKEEKNIAKDSDLYKAANITKSTWNNLINGKDVSRDTVIAIALGLKLDLSETQELLRLWAQLNESNKFDKTIIDFINQKNYNMIDINIALDEKCQKTLGHHPREQKSN